MYDKGHEGEQGWRQGISKRHKVPCAQCDGFMHARGPGRHFSTEVLRIMKAKRERQRAAACGAGQVVQAGQ